MKATETSTKLFDVIHSRLTPRNQEKLIHVEEFVGEADAAAQWLDKALRLAQPGDIITVVVRDE